jgi:Kdo2-lipid IVA lauroyltransferase/acyltransferase
MLFRLFLTLWRRLGCLPLAWLHLLGRLLGLCYWLVPNRERHTALINLALCFPELSERRRKALCRRTLQQMGCYLMELPVIWFRPMSEVTALVRKSSGEEHLRRAPGQGLILLSPHLGNWELVGLIQPPDEEFVALYRPPRKGQLEPLMKQARERNGMTIVPTDSRGVKQIYLALQRGNLTCLLPDQVPKSNSASVFAPFFGQPALTMLLVNRLVKKTGAKVVIAYAERLPRGEGFHIHYRPAPAGVDDDDPQRAATAVNLGLEAVIRESPEQYQWSYKRFRIQPGDAPSPYRREEKV